MVGSCPSPRALALYHSFRWAELAGRVEINGKAKAKDLLWVTRRFLARERKQRLQVVEGGRTA